MYQRAWCSKTRLSETTLKAKSVEITLLRAISRPSSLRAIFVVLWMLSCQQQGHVLALLWSMRDLTQSTRHKIRIPVAHVWPQKWWSLSLPVVPAMPVPHCTKRLFQTVVQFLLSKQSRPENRRKDSPKRDTNLPWESLSKKVRCSTKKTRVAWDIRKASEDWRIQAIWPLSERIEVMM